MSINPPGAIGLPFDFYVPGKPVSHQTKDRDRLNAWKAHCRKCADEAWGDRAMLGDRLIVTITHFYDSPDLEERSVPDSDNIVKPVRDAWQGILYQDDYQISDFLSKRRNLNGSFRVRGISAALAAAFCSGQEFLYVILDNAPAKDMI